MVRRLLRIDRDNRSGVRSSAWDAPAPAREGRNHMAGKEWTRRGWRKKYLRLFRTNADMAIRYVQTWMPMVASQQLT